MNPAQLVRRVPLKPHQLIEPITPQDDLFVLAHMGLPVVDAADWRVEVGGLVERPLSLKLEEIKRRPLRRVQTFHQCAGFPRRPDVPIRRVGNVVWGGADLAELLDEAGVRPEARYLWSVGLDHGEYDGERAEAYVKDLPLARLAEGGVLLAWEVNGEPLSLEHGWPLRLVVPGYYGTNAVKWLRRIELADRRPDGPFTTVFYNDPAPNGGTRPVWDAPPEALIVAPAPGAALAPEPVEIWGRAWAGAGIERVEVSVDGGASWLAAAVDPRTDWSWQRFALRWTPPAPGAYTLVPRATDSAGTVQPLDAARNAAHRVPVTVGG